MLQSVHMVSENMAVVDEDRGRGDMKDAKVAIVVPAYNVERGLVDSVRSVLKQTLQALEVWIVNDGSKDGTAEVAERLMKEDPRIHVIHQPNRGAYRARLTAFRLLRTPFFASLDADDWAEPDMYAKMVEWADRDILDVVQCRQAGDQFADGSRDLLSTREEVENKLLKPMLLEGQAAFFVWDKLYRNTYDFSRFVEAPVTMFEDIVFNLQFSDVSGESAC